MTGTDSISVFSEGTFEEQIQELVGYIVRNTPEETRAAFIRPFQEAFKEDSDKPTQENVQKRQKIFAMTMKEIKGLGEGSDKEMEGFFNMVFSHLLSLYPSDSPELKEYLSTLLSIITSASPSQTPIKYRILSNLFNALPRTSSLRYPVYSTLLNAAIENDDANVVQLSQADAEKWLSEWSVSTEEKSAFLKSLVDAHSKFAQPITSYTYQLSYVESLPPSSDEAKTAAIDAIATALRLPSVFNFDPLFKLDAVVASKDHELFSLLQVFLNGGLADFKSWQDNHPHASEKYKLDAPVLEHKIRLLTLASLGFQKVGQHVSYSQVAETLQVDISEVEKWIIDVIRAGLLSGKISQTNQTILVVRSTARTFERQQWEVLEKRLLAWKSGLTGVLEVVASARHGGVIPVAA